MKSKETGVCSSKGNVIVLCLAHEHSICYKRAKYMTFSLAITDPFFLAFYTTIAFKSYILPTFSQRMFLVTCVYVLFYIYVLWLIVVH